MSHEQADNIAGVAGGSILTILVQAAEFAHGSTVLGDFVHALLTGAVGGFAGYGVKWIIEKYNERKRKKNE